MVLTIKAARVNCNLTIVQAAQELGINKDTLSRLERNSTDISISLAQKMTQLYHVPLENLFFGKLEDFKVGE
ncbi:helix-turn-helix transcriptional regulator [Carnobacteriaceae bacterium zg-ZUI252]|nr:helix-turn-helix transcriptional regulator [Carnobacteriaceae bacterium zg-ZUI252]MBS4769869.1 helix-turn-helix transcriptional regulator [Carnobacteriaceae bacterium zg-ZUI240]QTU82616.1 helix-turn-helix transcriptional regulator [Carnobacteriaceae bacterium zg-C25]